MNARQNLHGQSPCVGIFWLVPDGDTSALVSDAALLSDAEPYGDCLTYPRGHYEVWEEWRGLPPSELIRRGLPTIISHHEYEEFPRGRVVYEQPSKHFIIYADRKLFDPVIIASIVERFGLTRESRSLQADDHYVA